MSANEPKWTPGRWDRNIPPATKYPTIFAGRNTHIAVVNVRLTPEQVEANANLIAAAPDLYKSLKELSDFYRFIWDRVDGEIVLMPERVEEFEQKQENARAALSKALGE